MDLSSLISELPTLLPKAIAWAETREADILQHGTPLNEPMLAVARSVGVTHPENIRIIEVSQLPAPDDFELKTAAYQTGLLGNDMIGMTFGYGIYVCRGHANLRLLSHEFRHVQQYEQAGSIAAFLREYLSQIIACGYRNAPLEIDAQAHEMLNRGY